MIHEHENNVIHTKMGKGVPGRRKSKCKAQSQEGALSAPGGREKACATEDEARVGNERRGVGS